MLQIGISRLVSPPPRTSSGTTVALIGLMLGACSSLNIPLPEVDLPNAVTTAFSGPAALKDRPLASSGDNAWPQASLLDDWVPRRMLSLTDAPRMGGGGFRLSPGVYEGLLQSYCVGIGSFVSPGGLGYVASALRGDRAEIVQAILRATSDHPGVEQGRVQWLLWAVIADTPFDQMSASVQATAVELLSQSDIRALGRSLMDDLSQEAWERAIAELPPEGRRVFAAEARIRELVAEANSTYADVERIAVVLGDPTPDPRDLPIPAGRWTRHPAGYFVRFFPNGYSRTRVQVAVPGRYTVERDAIGRVIAVDLGGGYRSEVSYSASIEARAHGRIAGLSAYVFSEIRFMRPDPTRPGEIETAVIGAGGYAFQSVRGVSGGLGVDWGFAGEDDPGPGGPAAEDSGAGPGFPVAQEAWRDFNRRRAQAEAVKERADALRRHAEWVSDPPPDDAIDELGNWEHYQDGLDAAIRGDPSDRWSWIVDQQERQYDALRLAADRLGTLPGESDDPDDSAGGPINYDPTSGVAVPGGRASQRLAVSGRPAG